MGVGPFYILLVALAGQPPYAWRVEGGYDSCLLMETMVQRYSGAPVATECVTNVEWAARGRPGQ